MADLYDGTTPPKKCPHTGDLFGADSLPTERFTPVEGGQWELVLSRDDEEDEQVPEDFGHGWTIERILAAGLEALESFEAGQEDDDPGNDS